MKEIARRFTYEKSYFDVLAIFHATFIALSLFSPPVNLVYFKAVKGRYKSNPAAADTNVKSLREKNYL